MKHTVMNRAGRLTIPAAIRRRLQLNGGTKFEVEVDESANTITLRPVGVVRRGDQWAYAPEHQELLARAHQDSREGRVRRMTVEELVRLAE